MVTTEELIEWVEWTMNVSGRRVQTKGQSRNRGIAVNVIDILRMMIV